MSFPLDDLLIDQLVEVLRERLPNEVAAVNARVTDGITIGVPEVLDYVPTLGELVDFPVIGIQEGEGVPEDDTGWSFTLRQPFGIIIFFQHHDQRTLARTLRRLRVAVANAALADRAWGDAWGVKGLGFMPGPVLGRENKPDEWMSYCGVGIEVRVTQDATPGS